MLKTIAGLHGVNILSKQAQKKVAGGLLEGGGGGGGGTTGTCAVFTPQESPVPNGGATSLVVSGPSWTYYGVSSSAAESAANAAGTGAHWCCSNCASASWYHPPTA